MPQDLGANASPKTKQYCTAGDLAHNTSSSAVKGKEEPKNRKLLAKSAKVIPSLLQYSLTTILRAMVIWDDTFICMPSDSG